VRPARAQCPDGTPPPCARPARLAAPPPPNSVAVLYFDNLSRDTADAYLADGLTEEMIARLGQVERLQVKSRNAVRRYRGAAADDPASIGRALGVVNLVSGSVRRAGRELRVTVELTRAATGVRVWGQQFDRADTNLLAVEADIAGVVATAIAGRLVPAERARLGARPTRSAAAYDRLLRGDFYLAQRTPQSVARAIGEYGAAAEADPTFARAHARVALAWALYVDWGWPYAGLTRDSMLTLGFHAADRALALDSADAEGWMGRAYLLEERNPRTYDGVVPAFERGVALDPRNPELLHQYASAVFMMGDDAGVQRWGARALAIDPDRPITLLTLGDDAWYLGRLAQARVWFDSAIAVDPQFYLAYFERARLRWQQGDRAGARDDAAATSRWSPTGAEYWGECAQAIVAAWAGDTASARLSLASELASLAGRPQLSVWEAKVVALALIALGDHARALDLLEQASPRGALFNASLRDPDFDPVRSDARFQRLVSQSRPPEAAR